MFVFSSAKNDHIPESMPISKVMQSIPHMPNHEDVNGWGMGLTEIPSSVPGSSNRQEAGPYLNDLILEAMENIQQFSPQNLNYKKGLDMGLTESLFSFPESSNSQEAASNVVEYITQRQSGHSPSISGTHPCNTEMQIDGTYNIQMQQLGDTWIAQNRRRSLYENGRGVNHNLKQEYSLNMTMPSVPNYQTEGMEYINQNTGIPPLILEDEEQDFLGEAATNNIEFFLQYIPMPDITDVALTSPLSVSPINESNLINQTQGNQRKASYMEPPSLGIGQQISSIDERNKNDRAPSSKGMQKMSKEICSFTACDKPQSQSTVSSSTDKLHHTHMAQYLDPYSEKNGKLCDSYVQHFTKDIGNQKTHGNEYYKSTIQEKRKKNNESSKKSRDKQKDRMQVNNELCRNLNILNKKLQEEKHKLNCKIKEKYNEIHELIHLTTIFHLRKQPDEKLC